MAILGGFKSSIGPLFQIITPALALFFLVQLGVIIRAKSSEDFVKEIRHLMLVTEAAIQKIVEDQQAGSLQFDAALSPLVGRMVDFIESNRSSDDPKEMKQSFYMINYFVKQLSSLQIVPKVGLKARYQKIQLQMIL